MNYDNMLHGRLAEDFYRVLDRRNNSKDVVMSWSFSRYGQGNPELGVRAGQISEALMPVRAFGATEDSSVKEFYCQWGLAKHFYRSVQ